MLIDGRTQGDGSFRFAVEVPRRYRDLAVVVGDGPPTPASWAELAVGHVASDGIVISDAEALAGIESGRLTRFELRDGYVALV